MEKDRVQRYAGTLEKTIQNNYHYLKKTMDDFQEMCRLVTPERNVPREIIADNRELYKEIRNRLTEIKAVEQLLQGKYRQYYHRDSLRDKAVMEFGFIAKNCYSKFENTLMQIEAMKKLKETSPTVEPPSQYFQWFHSKENQIALIKNLRLLMELDYESTPEGGSDERRGLTGPRNLTFFLLYGDPASLDKLQSQTRFREHDIIERHQQNEIRGVFTHLREIELSEVETVIHRLLEREGLTQLKCLLLPIHSPKDFEGDLLNLIKTTLQEMAEGELKTLSI
jgi:hypothetical protein